MPSNAPRFTNPLRNPYFLHLRPLSWPTVAGHFLAGAMMAYGLQVLSPPMLWKTILGTIVWTIFLHGGTLAYNSAFDKDEGDIGFLDNPPTPPDMLQQFSMTLMVVGAIGAFYLGTRFFLIYAFSVFMSWLYSAPPARLKTRGGWDVVINSLGYGCFTALAGWYAAGRTLQHTQGFIFIGYAALFAAVYPMTQFYQREEDKRKNALTLVLMLGERWSMIFIHLALLIAIVSWLIAAGGQRPATQGWGWLCILVPSAAWLAFAGHWWANFSRYNHKAGFYWSMLLWAFTNVFLILGFYYAQG